jgi:serine/threonine protein kinase
MTGRNSQSNSLQTLRYPQFDKGSFSRTLTLSQPENILLATPGSYPRVLIADFGLAKERAYEPTGNVAGTISYLPPEAVYAMTVKQKYVVQTTDAW